MQVIETVAVGDGFPKPRHYVLPDDNKPPNEKLVVYQKQNINEMECMGSMRFLTLKWTAISRAIYISAISNMWPFINKS